MDTTDCIKNPLGLQDRFIIELRRVLSKEDSAQAVDKFQYEFNLPGIYWIHSSFHKSTRISLLKKNKDNFEFTSNFSLYSKGFHVRLIKSHD